MWALVESGSVTQIYTRPKAIVVGDVNYPANIFMLWSASELEALGIYSVVFDNTNLKDEKYYVNTNQSFNFASGTVTASYGTATAKPMDDVLFTAQDETDGLGTEGEVKQPGIRQGHIDTINAQAGNMLAPTDWMVVRAAEGGTAVPSSITTKRAAVRTKANAMCTQITNAADVDALAALYVYNDATPPVRPLGELPTVE
tara:strand:+ start:10335 stop:10934 length:600 start_codon:yes stop_codon:yes gene_type:complete